MSINDIIMIVEPSVSGHRLTYVKFLMKSISENTNIILVTTPEAPDTPEYARHMTKMIDSLSVIETEDFSLNNIYDIAKSSNVNRIIILNGDIYLKNKELYLGKKGLNIGLTLLIMRPIAQPRSNVLSTFLGRIIKRALIFAARLTDSDVISLVSAVDQPGATEVADPISVIRPTPAAQANLRQRFNLEDKKWVGVVGAITARKNIPTLLKAVIASNSRPGIVIAGRISPEAQADVRLAVEVAIEEKIDIRIVDELLDDEDLDCLISVLDVVAIIHSNEGPSGILGKAIALQTPVLASGASSLRLDILHAPTAGRWVPLSDEAISIGLDALLAETDDRKSQESINESNILMFGEKLLSPKQKRNALYLAVLPFYRQACMESFVREVPNAEVYVGEKHIDATISTGITKNLYTPIKNYVIAGRVLVQAGHLREALAANTLIVDLNPRSVSAWQLLLLRRLTGRRTLVWGHLHPRKGATARTAGLRRFMRRLSNGTVLYGFDSVGPARAEIPSNPVWVAPNALYHEVDMANNASDGPYHRILYVGRLVAVKKVELLVRAFALSGMFAEGCRLTLVGDGTERRSLEELAVSLGIAEAVEFLGHVADVEELRKLYDTAICSVSPGYAGLSLTQSLGFGVPVVVSKDELHAPEIELVRFGGVTWFETDSATDLAETISRISREGMARHREALVKSTISTYSAENMAAGLAAALNNTPQDLGDDGWPQQ